MQTLLRPMSSSGPERLPGAPLAAAPRRAPVAYFQVAPAHGGSTHDAQTKMAVAGALADLLGVEFLGEREAGQLGEGGVLVVPSDTIVGPHQAERLGIRGDENLFGGVVPHPFVASKVISHPLVRDDAPAPQGWSPVFGAVVRDVVLPGFSAFTLADALTAGETLLRDGAVRVKEPDGVGGLGQHVVHDVAELEACLAGIDPSALTTGGLVLERNLRDVVTLSVGQVSVGPWLISYCGTQGLTRNHHGVEVYGGSTLTVARGGYAELLALRLDAAQRSAVEQALTYHAAALDCFGGLLVTRANYDIARGLDEAGRPCSGVLEQSWRIGGASGAELAALRAFDRDPALRVVRASTHEVYGTDLAVPADAWITYQGVDQRVGALTKYARTEAHDDI